MKLEKDIKVFYVTAESFPGGIKPAMDKLTSLLNEPPGRSLFGISRPENGGGIVYRAAAEELENGESNKHGCETLIIKKGEYVAMDVAEFRKDVMAISRAFEELLRSPNLDPEGYCIEWYATDKEAVKCMIRLDK